MSEKKPPFDDSVQVATDAEPDPKLIKAEANKDLEVLGILPTRHKRTVHAREVVEQTQAELGEQIHIFGPPISESTRFTEATGQGKTVFDIAPEIPGAQAYQSIAQEIVTHAAK